MPIPGCSACTRITEITSLSLGKLIETQFLLNVWSWRKCFYLKQPVGHSVQSPPKQGFAFHRKLQLFIRKAKIHPAKRFSAFQMIEVSQKNKCFQHQHQVQIAWSPRTNWATVSCCSHSLSAALIPNWASSKETATPTMSKHYSWVKISLNICSFVHD